MVKSPLDDFCGKVSPLVGTDLKALLVSFSFSEGERKWHSSPRPICLGSQPPKDGQRRVPSSVDGLDSFAECVLGLGRQFHKGSHLCEIA